MPAERRIRHMLVSASMALKLIYAFANRLPPAAYHKGLKINSRVLQKHDISTIYEAMTSSHTWDNGQIWKTGLGL
jgi:hypothetical protein